MQKGATDNKVLKSHQPDEAKKKKGYQVPNSRITGATPEQIAAMYGMKDTGKRWKDGSEVWANDNGNEFAFNQAKGSLQGRKEGGHFDNRMMNGNVGVNPFYKE